MPASSGARTRSGSRRSPPSSSSATTTRQRRRTSAATAPRALRPTRCRSASRSHRPCRGPRRASCCAARCAEGGPGRLPGRLRRLMDTDMLYDDDADLSKLDGKTVAILGFGSQGHAHALNLKESGAEVVVGLRPGSASRAEAEAAGLRVLDVADAASEGDIVMILLPDEKQAEVWENEIRDGIA